MNLTWGANFVLNPSFERGSGQSAENWNLWGGSGDISMRCFEISKGGQFSLKLERRRNDDWAGASSARWRVNGVKHWFVSAFVKSYGGGNTDFLYLRFWDKEENFIKQEGPRIPSNAREWTFVSGLVDTPLGAEFVDFSAQVWAPSGCIVYIDDVFVSPADEEEPRILRKEAVDASNKISPFFLIPGTDMEERWLEKSEKTTASPGVRLISPGGYVLYKFPSEALTYKGFRVECEGSLIWEIWTKNKWQRINEKGREKRGSMTICSYRIDWEGKEIKLRMRTEKEAKLYKMDFYPDGPDFNLNGISDYIEQFLGEELPKEGGPFAKRYDPPRTSFQNPIGYLDSNDLKTDIAIVADNDPIKIASLREKGYEPHTMYGFRDGDAYVKEHPDEVQTTEDGTKLTCGPGSYYLVPTQNRVRKALEYFRRALEGGTRAICPEEPEFFAIAGYSEAFKKAFQEKYNRPWSDSQEPRNRWLWEVLKGDMFISILSEIYKLANSYDPTVKRFLLAHSPLNYTAIGIVFPHYKLLKTGLVDEAIDQTWSDMIRNPLRYAGENKQRLVENAYLNYASAVGYAYGLVKNLWFLQDPLADNPSLSMDEYRREYEATVISALFFPQVSQYEVMPWPVRIFGRIPQWYEREVMSVVQALSEMKDFDGQLEWGNPHGEVGVVIGDGAVYQRGGPYASDMDAFYGLMLPVLYMGYFLDIPHLDRFSEKNYLDKYKVLLLSYDPQKPLSSDVNEVLADWVKRGGQLVIFGGGDAFDEVDEWWKAKGFDSPQDHLLHLLGIDVKSRRKFVPPLHAGNYQVALETPYKGRLGENRGWYEVELTPYLRKTGEVFVKFEDTIKGDGWGPAVFQVEIDGEKEGSPFKISFKPGEALENEYMFLDKGSQMAGDMLRFADGQAYWIYRFKLGKDTTAKLRIDIQNQFRISLSEYDERRALDCIIGVSTSNLKEEVPVLPLKGETSLSSYDVPEEVALCESSSLPGKICFKKKVGKGGLYFFGFNPAVCARSREGARLVQAIVEEALKESFGEIPQEKGRLLLKRGPYIICYSFEDRISLKGNFINIFSPQLTFEKEHTVNPGEWCLLRDVSERMKEDVPSLLWTSSKLNWLKESPSEMKILLSGPEGASAAIRIYLNNKELEKLEAIDSKGTKLEVSSKIEGKTLYIEYTNKASGLAIKVKWR